MKNYSSEAPRIEERHVEHVEKIDNVSKEIKDLKDAVIYCTFAIFIPVAYLAFFKGLF